MATAINRSSSGTLEPKCPTYQRPFADLIDSPSPGGEVGGADWLQDLRH
jgi:hypothetical protein